MQTLLPTPPCPLFLPRVTTRTADTVVCSLRLSAGLVSKTSSQPPFSAFFSFRPVSSFVFRAWDILQLERPKRRFTPDIVVFLVYSASFGRGDYGGATANADRSSRAVSTSEPTGARVGTDIISRRSRHHRVRCSLPRPSTRGPPQKGCSNSGHGGVGRLFVVGISPIGSMSPATFSQNCEEEAHDFSRGLLASRTADTVVWGSVGRHAVDDVKVRGLQNGVPGGRVRADHAFPSGSRVVGPAIGGQIASGVECRGPDAVAGMHNPCPGIVLESTSSFYLYVAAIIFVCL